MKEGKSKKEFDNDNKTTSPVSEEAQCLCHQPFSWSYLAFLIFSLVALGANHLLPRTVQPSFLAI